MIRVTELEPIVLAEFESTERALTVNEAQALNGIVPNPGKDSRRERKTAMLAVSPAANVGQYRITANSLVGSVHLGGRTVYVEPKIGAARTLFMASYAFEKVAWLPEGKFSEADDFDTLIVPALVQEVSGIVQKGILEDYQNVEDSASFIRGRIRFADQMRRQRGLPLPVELSYEDFTPNVPANQLLKAALVCVLGMHLVMDETRIQCRSLLSAFDAVSLIPSELLLQIRIPLLPRNERYGRAIELSRLILRYRAVEAAATGIAAAGVVFDMNAVFEDFTYEVLAERLSLRGYRLVRKAAGHRLYLDEDNQVKLEPDISVWRGESCLFVGDIKYKNLSEKGTVNADLYQVLSYAIAVGQRRTMLIYAGTNDEPSILVPPLPIEMAIRAVDLTVKPVEMIQQLESIADEITHWIDG